MELTHRDILQANAAIMAGMMLLFAIIFSFEQVPKGYLLSVLSFVSKVVICIPSVFFVRSMSLIIRYSMKPSGSKDQTSSKALGNMFLGLWLLFALVVLFVFVHEYVLLVESLD